MTYTVKNGTWCKDNQGEYLSTTLTGLKAMRKAGQVPEGTRVVVHEPRQPAGTLIQSLNPNPPEGFFVPDGSAFDTEVYTDLAALFPDGNLPDLREYVLVCAGQNTHITTHNHDVFAAGEFKDDQAQLVEHIHDVTDTGHIHSITDPGHAHGITDPGHSHDITDPGHTHSNAVDGNNEDGRDKNKIANGGPNYEETLTWETDVATSNVIVNSATTGITVNSAKTGVTANSATTGITVNAKGDNNVTRTKQFGVYFYIAF